MSGIIIELILFAVVLIAGLLQSSGNKRDGGGDGGLWDSCGGDGDGGD
jgi:hypothetical protein